MSASNTETETESGSPDQQPECEFDADDLDIPDADAVREFYGLEEWECSRPVWEEASGNRCVWHTSDGQNQEKPHAELEKTVDDGDLHGSAATGVDLSEIDFPVETGFIDADLSRAYLEGADLSEANLSGANLFETNLSSANLSGTHFLGADLGYADLEDADLSEADLFETNLSSANLSGTHFLGADLGYADLTRADLSGADLEDADLSEADLEDADLSSANFSGAYLLGVNLSNANLSGAYLLGANLLSANLSGADLSGADIRATTIKNIILNNKTSFRYIWTPLPDWLSNMSEHARAYENLRIKASSEGYNKVGRVLYVLEKKSRTRAALSRTKITTFVGGVLSGLLTGYGVRPRQVLFSTVIVLIITSVWFNHVGVFFHEWNYTYQFLTYEFNTGSIFYSVTTFVTAPPNPPQNTDLITDALVTIETYAGTVLTLLLGYTLTTRDRI